VVYGGTWIYIVGDTLGLMVVFKGLEVWGHDCCFVFFHYLPIIFSSIWWDLFC
jgi:hypothetical protein